LKGISKEGIVIVNLPEYGKRSENVGVVPYQIERTMM
jgi:hypothetical protein